MLQEETNPLGRIQLVERVVVHDPLQQYVRQLADLRDGLLLHDLFEVVGAACEGQMQNLDTLLNYTHLSHYLLLELKVSRSSSEYVVDFKTERGAQVVRIVRHIVKLLVLVYKLNHLTQEVFDFLLSLLRLLKLE